MVAPIKLNFKIYQGSTFNEVLRWESSDLIYVPITGITRSAPMVINATGHGIPVGWRTKVTNVAGMTEVNSTDKYLKVTAATADSITINAVNSLGFKDYVSGGVLEYNKPIDLLGYTARMQVRSKIQDPLVILEATTENTMIALDNTAKTISLNISATATALLEFTSAVYSLELVSSGGQVNTLVSGSITLIKEVTR